MASIGEALSIAVELHQSGKIEDAEEPAGRGNPVLQEAPRQSRRRGPWA